jgi:GT2 family glycosyltransferase
LSQDFPEITSAICYGWYVSDICPDVSIVIASYNTAAMTIACVKSVISNTKRVTFEIVVVDDCSPDDTVSRIENEFPEVRIFVNPVNVRYAKTNNRGLLESRGRYGLLLNTDTLLTGDVVSNLVEFMDKTSNAAAAGPKLLNPDGSIQHCVRGFPGLGTMILQSLNLQKFWPTNPWTNKYYNTTFDYSLSQPVNSIGTTAFIIRRSTWETLSMLDEEFSWAFCDQAYCLALRERNAVVYYVAGEGVTHLGSQSINQNTAKEIRLLHGALLSLYRKYLRNSDGNLKAAIVKEGIRLRMYAKLLENRLSKDKRLIKGPGAPSPKASS